MKVDAAQERRNGRIDGTLSKIPVTASPPCIQQNVVDVEMVDDEGTTTNGCVSGENLTTASISSPLSVSDVDSTLDNDLWSLSHTASDVQSDAESSDLDDIVTAGTDVCHAVTLEAFLENLEFVPAELNRILKLIGTLDEKCEEITELLEHPCDEWFALHRTKKQKKSAIPEQGETINGETTQPVLSNTGKEFLIYRKIYEGQDAIPFEMYKTRLARARRLERNKEIEARSNELISLPDHEFKIVYEKGKLEAERTAVTLCTEDEVMGERRESEPLNTAQSAKEWDGPADSVNESQESKRTKPKTPEKEKMPMDPVDRYFHKIEQEAASLNWEGLDLMEIDYGGLEEASMGEEWKEKVDELVQENRMNQLPGEDIKSLQSFMDNQLTLLWRYTLRKKALTRKAYEMVLHHYAALVQELEPGKFGASLRCYPEASVIQRAMLNELEEQYVSMDEMTELYKDVEELLVQCDLNEDGYASVAGDATFHQDPLPEPMKQEATVAASPFCRDRRLLVDENYRSDKSGTCASRPPVTGAVSVYSPSTGSAQLYARSDGPSNVGETQLRRSRNKNLKPAKAPSGMSHAAKSPQSTGRLLTYHDIATAAAAEKLSGRLAELFWPDDDLWYLIHIDYIDPETKAANISYTTGDTEKLDLDDIVREGHMSLLPEAEDTDLSADEELPQPMADVDLADEANSELSASEMRGAVFDDPSPDDDDMVSEDEEDVMLNMRNRQLRGMS